MENKGIIFDIDGTLWDSTEQVVESWNTVMDRHPEVGYRMTLEQLQGYMGKILSEIGALFLPHLEEDVRMKIMQEACEEEFRYLRLHPGKLYTGMEETLEALSREYKLFIVSNCQDGYIEVILDDYNLNSYFTDTECSGRTGLCKGDNIKEIVKRNHLTKAIYVGDTQGDLDATIQADIPFVFAEYGFGSVTGTHPTIQEPLELLRVVDKLLY